MQLGYTLIYVPDVIATAEFYERAFGLKRKFVHPSQQYAEMDTGATVLAFASNEMASGNELHIRTNRKDQPAAGFEVCLVTTEPHSAFEQAVREGAESIRAPEVKPWGQTVAFLRDLNGCLVEICTPVNRP